MSNASEEQRREGYELRGFRRVDVGLRVAIVLDRETAYMARTGNASEGGIMIHEYRGPRLQGGRIVGVNIRGVISDAGDEDPGQYLMKVVRHSGDRLALRFI